MVERRRSVDDGLDSTVAALQAELVGITRLLSEIDKRYAQQFTSQEKAVASALAAAEKAVAVAEQNAEKWRAGANEWRGAMDDREMRFVQKEHLNPMLGSLQKEVTELKEYSNQATGRSVGMDKFWGYLVAAAGSGGVAAFFLERIMR